jgi:hypothetical protein
LPLYTKQSCSISATSYFIFKFVQSFSRNTFLVFVLLYYNVSPYSSSQIEINSSLDLNLFFFCWFNTVCTFNFIHWNWIDKLV